MTYKNIVIEKIENVGVLRINHEKHNSIDIDTSYEIFKGLKELEKDKKIKCIALTGNEFTFSTGADIKELNSLNSKSAKLKGLFNNFDKISKIQIPIISLVDGHALGAGLELCLITDFIIASSEAKFGLPEINLGLIPGIGGIQRLKAKIGIFNTNYLCMTGDIITSTTAFELGIVNRVISKDQFKQTSMEIVKKISKQPKSSLVFIKHLTLEGKIIKRDIKKTRKIFYKLLDSENKKIGIESFFKKIKPIWKD